MYTLTSIREWSRVYVKIASSRMVLIKTIKMFSTGYALSNDQGILLLNIDPRKMKTFVHTGLNGRAQGGILCRRQKVETAHRSVHG